MRGSRVFLLVASLTACGNPTAVRQVDVVAKAHADGGYHLRLWNGKTLPATIATGVPGSSATVRTEVIGGDLTILNDSWTVVSHQRVTWVGDSVTTHSYISRGTVYGTYLAMPGAGAMTVAFSGNDATVRCCASGVGQPVGGEVYVYSR